MRWPINLSLLFVASLLASCAQPPRSADAPTATATAGGGPRAASPGVPAVGFAAARYQIDPQASLLTLRVMRGGPMARLGHNHVIAARQIVGEVDVATRLEDSRVSLRIPVALLSVDESPLRVAAGADFAADVPDSAREGTRRNMLGEALLNAARFPGIELHSESIRAAGSGWLLVARVEVAGHASTIDVPLQIARSDAGLVASGELALRQSALGLQPFSVMMGALQVVDEMQVSFRIEAHR